MPVVSVFEGFLLPDIVESTNVMGRPDQTVELATLFVNVDPEILSEVPLPSPIWIAPPHLAMLAVNVESIAVTQPRFALIAPPQ
jgi:hypothetical protein